MRVEDEVKATFFAVFRRCFPPLSPSTHPFFHVWKPRPCHSLTVYSSLLHIQRPRWFSAVAFLIFRFLLLPPVSSSSSSQALVFWPFFSLSLECLHPSPSSFLVYSILAIRPHTNPFLLFVYSLKNRRASPFSKPSELKRNCVPKILKQFYEKTLMLLILQ